MSASAAEEAVTTDALEFALDHIAIIRIVASNARDRA